MTSSARPPGRSFPSGGGSLGGAVTSNAPGAGVALAGGTLTLNANGSLTLSAPTTPGTYTFQYRLDNAQGNSDGTVTIQVNKAPAITSLSAANFVLNAAGTFSIVTTGTPTVSSITLTGCTLPTGLTFSYTSGANATIAGTPSAGGVVSCTVTASNGVAPERDPDPDCCGELERRLLRPDSSTSDGRHGDQHRRRQDCSATICSARPPPRAELIRRRRPRRHGCDECSRRRRCARRWHADGERKRQFLAHGADNARDSTHSNTK